MAKNWDEVNKKHGEYIYNWLASHNCNPMPSGKPGQYMAHCPFHEDETPSLSLKRSEGVFNCFGCKISGTIWDFKTALRQKGFTNPAWDTKYCAKARQQKIRRKVKKGIDVPILQIDEGQVRVCFEEIIAYWQECLKNPDYIRLVCTKYETTFTKTAYDRHSGKQTSKHYSYVSPEFTQATIERFGLGFAPQSSTELTQRLKEKYPREAILATGLFRKHGNNGLITPMGGRIIYPYLVQNTPVYAIGRITDKTPSPLGLSKYCKQRTRTREGKLLPMRNPSLFNIDTLAEAELVVITEGITDAIKSCEAGIASVSPVTTAFIKSEMDAIAEMLSTKKVLICNDNEKSGVGEQAADNMCKELSERGVRCGTVLLPREKETAKVDICSYILAEGEEEYRNLIYERAGMIWG